MPRRYPPILAAIGAAAVAAGMLGDWPAADPSVGGTTVPVAVVLAGIAAAFAVAAATRWSELLEPVPYALVVLVISLATLTIGAQGYAGVLMGEYGGALEEAAALLPPMAVLLGGTLAGIGAVGDWLGVEPGVARRQARVSVVMTGVGVAGLIAMFVWAQVLFIKYLILIGSPTMMEAIVVSNVALGLGMGTVALVYLFATDRGLGFIDLRMPTLMDLAWTVVGIGGLIAVLIGLSLLLHLIGTPPPEHGLVEDIRQEGDPAIVLYVLIPSSILLIGPGEELLFRNIIQKSLYDHFSRFGAVIVASVIFALAHIPAYWAGAGTITAIVVLTALSLALGGIYAKTQNIIVPAVIHGCYNAILFTILYVSMTTDTDVMTVVASVV